MYVVKVTQFRLIKSLNHARTLTIEMPLNFIPQIGSFFQSYPWVDGKVREVWHEADPHRCTHKVYLHEDTSGIYPSFDWDALPDNVKAGPIFVPHPDGGFTLPENLNQ